MKQETSDLQQLKEEIKELHHEKKTFTTQIDRAEKRKIKIEEQMNEIKMEYEQQILELDQQCERQKLELQKLQELTRSQSQMITTSKQDNEERIKRRLEELASLEVNYNKIQAKNLELNEIIKTNKNQITEAQNKNTEFQEVIRKLNLEKGELTQQISVSKKNELALKNTKETQQEMLDNIRRIYSEKLILIDQLQGDLENLREVNVLLEQQMEVGKEETELLTKDNLLLQNQIKNEREKNAKKIERLLSEINELNEVIQMTQAIEEEQLQLELESAESEGSNHSQSVLRKENVELKKRLQDSRMEVSLLEAEKQLLNDQLILLQEDFDFSKSQSELDRNEELKYRKILNDQINQLQERLKNAEVLRLEEITNLENLKQRTFNNIQQQLAKEQSINQANLAKVKKLTEQNKELEMNNHDLVASMAMMIKDSGEECERIDELEDKLRKSQLKHKSDAKIIYQLQQQIQQLQSRLKLKRPYTNTLPPPTPLVISSFPYQNTDSKKIVKQPVVIQPEDQIKHQNLKEQKTISTNNQSTLEKDKNLSISINNEIIINENPTTNVVASSSFDNLEELENIISNYSDEPEKPEDDDSKQDDEEEEKDIEKELLSDVVDHICDLLPNIEAKATDFTSSIHSSLLLCKLINQIVPGTIDERAINPNPNSKEEEIQNLNLCVNSAKAIGCDVPNIQVQQLIHDPTQLETLTWEIIRTELLSKVSLRKHPEIMQLQQDMELQAQIVDIQSLTPQELLLHWVNHHISPTLNASQNNIKIHKISNFEEDFATLETHFILLKNLCELEKINISNVPEFSTSNSWESRVEIIESLADLLNCKKFLYTKEIKSGNSRLNIAFLANLFHHHSGLQYIHPVIENDTEIDFKNDDNGTREERGKKKQILYIFIVY